MNIMWMIRISDFLTYIWLCLALAIGYHPRQSWASTVLMACLCALGGSALILLQEKLYPSYALYQLSYVAMGILFSVISLKGQNGLKCTTAVFYCSLFFLLYNVCFGLLPKAAYWVMRIVLQSMHILLMSFVARYPLNSHRRVPTLYWTPIMAVCVLMMVMPLWPRNLEAADRTENVIVSLCMICTLMIIYSLCGKLIRDYERQLVQINLQDPHENETAMREENARLSAKLHRERHEMRNHLTTLTALVQENRQEEALSLLKEIAQPPSTVEDSHSGNTIVDAILTRYQKLAEERGITFRSSICLDAPVPIRDSDLSSLINNLLSNALEASDQLERPEVEVRLFPAKDYLCLFVRNRADSRRLQANPLLHTTKRHPESHGIGLQVVRGIAEKYHGWMEITTEDDWFSVQVMLLLEDTAESVGTTDQ